MKESAVTHEAKPQDDSSAFQRFAKAMRALVAVPKYELTDKMAEAKPHLSTAFKNKANKRAAKPTKTSNQT